MQHPAATTKESIRQEKRDSRVSQKACDEPELANSIQIRIKYLSFQKPTFSQVYFKYSNSTQLFAFFRGVYSSWEDSRNSLKETFGLHSALDLWCRWKRRRFPLLWGSWNFSAVNPAVIWRRYAVHLRSHRRSKSWLDSSLLDLKIPGFGGVMKLCSISRRCQRRRLLAWVASHFVVPSLPAA